MWVKDCVSCLGGVGNEVFGMEVGDGVGEVLLGFCLEGVDVLGCGDECSVVCIGVDVRVLSGGEDVVDVEEEEGGG